MALITAELTARDLILRAEGAGAITVPLQAVEPPPLRTVSIWRSSGLQAEDCGREAAAWLSDFLHTPCHLVRIGRAFRRPVFDRPQFAPDRSGPEIDGRIEAADLVNFADGFPFLVTTEASLDSLNDRLVAAGDEPIGMDRFRPSLVISGASPFAEDTWDRLQIGSITFRSGGPCARCIVITTDQLTGERSPEPLRVLSSYRRDPADSTRVNFGQNLVHQTKSGTLRVGDPVALV